LIVIKGDGVNVYRSDKKLGPGTPDSDLKR